MAETLDNLYPKCICCGETPELGIMGGIVIWGRFVCDECQDRLADAEIGEPLYDRMVEAVKEMWTGSALYRKISETSKSTVLLKDNN